MPDRWRLFLAINLTEGARSAVVEATAPLRLAAPRIRWVPPERLHLTMKFLGSTPASDVEPLVAGVQRVAERHSTFAIDCVGLGAFPNLRRPRIVWLGVTPDPRLELLYHDVEACCAAAGHALDGRVFRPHVTLGRADGTRDGADRATAEALRDAARAVRVHAQSLVRSIDLMRSETGPEGPRYAVVASASLADPVA